MTANPIQSTKQKALTGRGRRSVGYEILSHLLQHPSARVGLGLTFIIVLIAFLAPWLAPYSPETQQLDFIRVSPSWQFLFGTDSLGRDLFSRILYGARITLLVGLTIIVIEVAIGVPLGMMAGYFQGRVDLFIVMLVDIVWAFPPLVLALGVIAAIGPNLFNAIIAISLVSWVPFARVTRAKVAALKQGEFVVASISIGATDIHILWHHILPNIIAINLVLAALTLPAALLTTSALSFLGLGVQPPTPEWGALLSEGRPYLQEAPWITTFPGLAILLTVLALNLLADGVRDVLDPKQRM